MGKKKRNTFKRGQRVICSHINGLSEPQRVISNGVSDSQRTLYHEAGHAIMNVIMGLPFEAVSLAKFEKETRWLTDGQLVPMTAIYTEGVIWNEERKTVSNEQALSGLLNLREAISDMAGPVCESIFVGEYDKSTRFHAIGDTTGICACCRAAIYGDDIENWKQLKMEGGILNAIALQAREILSKNLAAIKAVAIKLAEKRYLTQAEVVEIMSAAGRIVT